MSPDDQASAPSALSFEREYDSASAGNVACSVCNAAPKDACFRCGRATLCARCADEFRAGRLPARSGGFFRALGYGALAAVGGSCAYYLISALTGYEFGLIGILLGFAVGAAVRNGSGGRGGWLYQVLAMALIYLAIVSTMSAATARHDARPDAGRHLAERVDAVRAWTVATHRGHLQN